MRTLVRMTAAIAAALFITGWLALESRAQAPEKSALVGAWTLNRELSDPPPSSQGRGGEGAQRGHGGYGRGGGMGHHGGYGGGMGRGGSGGGQGRMNADPEEMARMRDAMRDIIVPPDHLTIVQTESMIVFTGPDGRTTRLAPDGKKVKDDNTKIERKTRWDAGKLVSEISGAGPGKIVQTYAADPETKQLRIAVQLERGDGNQPRTIEYVYDTDVR
jgi:hypothetical protein